MSEKTSVHESPEPSGSTGTMPPEHVKVFEQKNGSVPVWMWLIPLLLVLAVGAWLLTRNHPADVTAGRSLGSVNFDTDQATLTNESQATLDQAAETMKQNPGMHLRVQGFTDSTGDPAHNVALSNQRSGAVTQYLGGKGIDTSRLNPQGFGDSNPVASNATVGGKADNRRVELFEQP